MSCLCVFRLTAKIKGEEEKKETEEEITRLKDTIQLLQVLHYFAVHLLLITNNNNGKTALVQTVVCNLHS